MTNKTQTNSKNEPLSSSQASAGIALFLMALLPLCFGLLYYAGPSKSDKLKRITTAYQNATLEKKANNLWLKYDHGSYAIDENADGTLDKVYQEAKGNARGGIPAYFREANEIEKDAYKQYHLNELSKEKI